MRHFVLYQFLTGGVFLLGLSGVACMWDSYEPESQPVSLQVKWPESIESSKIDGSNPSPLLRQAEQRLKAINRYRGTGKAVSVSFNGEESVETETEFAVEYEKPERLLLKWTVDDKRFEFRTGRDQVEHIVDGEIVSRDTDAMWGLFSVGTKSGGRYRFELATIFLGSERDSRSIPSFSILRGVEIIGTDLVNGRECKVIQGSVHDDPDLFIRYCIDPVTFMIERYERIFRSPKRGVITALFSETYYHEFID